MNAKVSIYIWYGNTGLVEGIRIQDTGIGLSLEQVERLNASKGITELGAGSVIILNMLRKIDGELSIQTSFGQGSTFTIAIG